MKVAPLIAVALILYIAFPGPTQAKKKPKPKKFCVGKDGNRYEVGEGYDHNEGNACTHYKCVKQKRKLVMKKKGKCAVKDGEWSLWSSWSACSTTCGSSTKTRKRTCSSPAPSNGGKPCSGPEEEVEDCSNPSCDGPGESVNVTALEHNVESLNASMQTLQTSMQSVLELMTTMQSTADKQGTCMMDLSSSDCPDSAPGKIGVVDGIHANKAGVTSTKADINTNKAGININKADINTNKADINTNNDDIDNLNGGAVLIHTDANYQYYKVPVPASSKMLSALLVSTCNNFGFTPQCHEANDKCVPAPSGSPHNQYPRGLSKILCNTINPHECASTLNMFWYMRVNWASGSACGATKAGYCVAGKDFTSTGNTPYFAACLKPV